MTQKMKMALGLLGIGGLCAIVTMVLIITRARAEQPAEHGHAPATESSDDEGIQVQTVRPHFDPNFTATVEQPAYVKAYYEDDLQARAAGPVKFLKVAIGEHVTKGQKLLVVDVPDLVQDVAQKKAVVLQRQREKELAYTAVLVAQANLKAKEAWADFKEREYKRFVRLAEGPSPGTTGQIVDERWRDWQTADAEKLEAAAKVKMARADVELKQSLIKVAEEDRDRAQEILNLATIESPYDGIITRRNVNPGGFVHNASTTADARPLLRVERTDIVTVYMKVPDRYAPFVTENTEAIIQMNELRGYVIRGKVTRSSNTLESEETDRTMRVEVDLYNGSPEEYEKFLAKAKATNGEDLKSGPLPWFPTMEGGNMGKRPRLLPGMYGTMTLVLQKFNKSMLLPMSAVVPRGGLSYVFIVKDGRAYRTPIVVEVDNGKVAKVSLLVRDGDRETLQEFTGNEEVIISNQGELSDGQKVNATQTKW